MKKTLYLILFILLSLLVFNCSKDSPTEPEEVQDVIMPFKVGNTWHYSNGDVITIISTDIADNGKLSYLFDGDDDYTFGKRALFYDENKLYGYELSDRTIRLLLDEGSISNNTEIITVPAGSFNAYKVQEANTVGSTTYWLVKGIGLVRRDKGSESRVLTSYSLKK